MQIQERENFLFSHPSLLVPIRLVTNLNFSVNHLCQDAEVSNGYRSKVIPLIPVYLLRNVDISATVLGMEFSVLGKVLFFNDP